MPTQSMSYKEGSMPNFLKRTIACILMMASLLLLFFASCKSDDERPLICKESTYEDLIIGTPSPASPCGQSGSRPCCPPDECTFDQACCNSHLGNKCGTQVCPKDATKTYRKCEGPACPTDECKNDADCITPTQHGHCAQQQCSPFYNNCVGAIFLHCFY